MAVTKKLINLRGLEKIIKNYKKFTDLKKNTNKNNKAAESGANTPQKTHAQHHRRGK